MIFSSFPIHSHLPLDLIEADFSLSLLLLATPTDCTKQTGACQRVASGKAAMFQLTPDLLDAICWL